MPASFTMDQDRVNQIRFYEWPSEQGALAEDLHAARTLLDGFREDLRILYKQTPPNGAARARIQNMITAINVTFGDTE